MGRGEKELEEAEEGAEWGKREDRLALAGISVSYLSSLLTSRPSERTGGYFLSLSNSCESFCFGLV